MTSQEPPQSAGLPAPESSRGVYGISVAAELAGMGVQNLRLYEARRLLEPERTAGGTRRYSADDLDRLRRIGELLGDGLNLAGIGLVMQLEHENARLRAQNAAQRRAGRAGSSASSERPASLPVEAAPVAAEPVDRRAAFRAVRDEARLQRSVGHRRPRRAAG